MNRVLSTALTIVGFALSGTAFAHPHYDITAVAGTFAALPLLLGVGIGISVGVGIGMLLGRKDANNDIVSARHRII